MASRLDRPVTAADIAALGNTGRPPLERGLTLVSLPLRAQLETMDMAMPTTAKDVRALAKELGSRREYFSCEHAAFTDDQSLILGCLGHVSIASNAVSVFPQFAQALAGAPASEWMFDFIGALGPDALMARPEDPRQGTDPLRHLRDAMQLQLQRWFWDARLGATPQRRKSARKQLGQIGSALAGDGRGRRGRPHDVFHVQLTYVVFLYRVARAQQLLQFLRDDCRWSGNLDDAVDLVMHACDLARYNNANDFDVFEALKEGHAGAEESARAVAGNICGITDPQMKNILAKPIRVRSAK